MADQPNLYGSTSDDELNQLIAQLSGPMSGAELDAGIGGAPGGFKPDYSTLAKYTNYQEHPEYAFGGSLGGASTIGQIQGGNARKAALKRKRASDKAYNSAVANYTAQRAARLQAAKRELQVRQTKNQINGYFKSDKMEGLYDSLHSNVLQNSIADIINKYDAQLKQSAFQTADQGLTGSSVDAERRGDADQSAQRDTIAATGQADSYVRSIRDQNDQQRRSLVDTLTADNPGDAAALESQTRGIMNNTQNITDQYAQQAAMSQINQNGMNMQSQAMGNLLSNYGSLYKIGQDAKGYNPKSPGAF